MCGIAGFVAPISHSQAEARLGDMLNQIGHRGPDECSGSVGPGFGIGTVRLSIVDLSSGTQPMISQDGKTYAVFNGEIFNYLDLKRQLELKGHVFKTKSEIEVLLHLYQEHGMSMTSMLNGQFAIAIWDVSSRTLHLARDPFGIRPLFWWSQGQQIAFASEVKAILANSEISVSLDPRSLLQTLTFWTCVGSQTAFREIFQVPPGHVLTWTRGEWSATPYWHWPFSFASAPLMLSRDEEYFDAFREKFSQAVKRQTMADVEVGAYISGGIDSSVIVHNLHALGGKRLSTYSVEFDDAAYDESNAQRAVVDQYGTRHHTTKVGKRDIANVFIASVISAETPLFRSAPAPMRLLSQSVRDSGLKVVLSGEGADEVLLGYDLFRETKVRQFWARQPDSRCRGHLLQRLYGYLPQYSSPRHAKLTIDFYRNTLTPIENPFYAMAVRWGNGTALKPLLSEHSLECLADYDPLAELSRWLPPGYNDADAVERGQAVEILTLLGNYLLSSQGDRMTAANGVEGRYPYLDLEFVRFASSLPSSIKLRGLKDKYILREAYANNIPRNILSRRKFAYQAPDKNAFFENGEAIEWVRDLLTEERLRTDGYFDHDFVMKYCLYPPASTSGRQGIRNNMLFMIALSTTILADTFIRSRPSNEGKAKRSMRLIQPQGLN